MRYDTGSLESRTVSRLSFATLTWKLTTLRGFLVIFLSGCRCCSGVGPLAWHIIWVSALRSKIFPRQGLAWRGAVEHISVHEGGKTYKCSDWCRSLPNLFARTIGIWSSSVLKLKHGPGWRLYIWWALRLNLFSVLCNVTKWRLLLNCIICCNCIYCISVLGCLLSRDPEIYGTWWIENVGRRVRTQLIF